MVAVSLGAWALRLAVVAGLVSLVGVRRRSIGVGAVAVTAGATVVAVLALVEAFWSKDFSLVYVADHARRDASTATRVSGLWGGMGGSLLFFALGTSVTGLVAAWRAPAADRGLVAAVAGAVSASLVGFVAVFSDPFDRLQIPAVDGAGLTPILEHPAMLYHPPLVYAGLTSLVAAFALSVAALGRDRLDDGWRTQVRRWLLVPWTLLAIGMLAGAHWAYVELGWGGYWAWDPVENTALLPWLAVTAALHRIQASTSASNRRRIDADADPPTLGVAVLVGGAFLLALLGGLLTRSGATTSVHAFAEERAIGRAFAALLFAVALGCAVLVARHRGRVPAPRPSHDPWWPPTRGRALGVQQVLVLGALAVVLLGSVWPLVAELRGGREVSVGGSFFASLCGPIAVLLLLAMAVGPSLGRLPIGTVALTPALGAALGVAWAGTDGWGGLFALSAAAAGGAAVAGTGLALVRGRHDGRRVGSHLAHLGVALFLLGVAGTTTGTTQTVSLAEGQSTQVHGRFVANHGVAVVDTPSDDTDVVEATVAVGDRTYRPQLVAHTTRNRLLAESALHSTPREDVQVMLRDARDDGSVVLQVGVHPLQQLVWWGAILLVVGGLVTFAGAGISRPDPGPALHPRRGVDAASRATIPARPPEPEPAPPPPLAGRDATAPSAPA